jgi:tetratricopeptide (TPR) repeat protein
MTVVLSVEASDREKIGLAVADSSRTHNRQAFEDYLKARSHFPAEGERSVPYLLDAIELDDEYAAAHALLAHCYTIYAVYYVNDNPPDRFDRGMKQVEDAIASDPRNGTARATLAAILTHRDNRVVDALEQLYEVLLLEGYNWEALFWSADFMEYAGRFDVALELRRRMALMNPLLPNPTHDLAQCLIALGDLEAAEETLLRLIDDHRQHVRANMDLALIKRALGDEDGYLKYLEFTEGHVATRNDNRYVELQKLKVAIDEDDLDTIEEVKQWMPDSLASDPDLFHSIIYYSAIEDERYFDVMAEASSRGHWCRFVERLGTALQENLGFTPSFWNDPRVGAQFESVGLSDEAVSRIDTQRWLDLLS